jgi:hypothetical protein
MSDETNERYVLEVGTGIVAVWDNVRMEAAQIFEGPDRLLAATAELNRLNATEETARTGVAWQAWTPAEFLAKRLPDVARRQRIEGHLTEVKEIEESLVRVLAEDAASLKRATALREKLEKELASPLSEPLAAQNADLVGQDTVVPFGFVERFQAAQRALRKPGPY